MSEGELSFLQRIFRVKNTDDIINEANKNSLKKTLTAFDLIVLGIGAVVGTGIFTLSGVAIAGSSAAGPSFMLSLIIASLACVFASLAYAEFASMIPVAGSAYTYTFAVFGEIVAWIIGWVLMLEYAIGNIAVAIALTSYWFQFLQGFKGILPDFIINESYWVYNFKIFGTIPFLLNIPSIFILLIITALLIKGIKESVHSAGFMVILKLAIIALFVFAGMFYVKPSNWTPFMPGGLSGVFQGAFLIFFAYIGFDAVSTAAEETKNPQKNVPIGIIGSLAICTFIYLAVAAVLTGLFPFDAVAGNREFIHAPLAYSLRMIHCNFIASLVSVGAIAGLFSVLLVLQLGSTRILFAMARDKLLPSMFAKVHPVYKTPHIITIAVGLLVILGTFFLDLEEAAHLCNIGTFTAFIIVSLGVIILRYREPDRKRSFKIPLMPFVPLLGIVISLFIIWKGIPFETFITFSVWIALGLIIYFAYGYKNTSLPEKVQTKEALPPGLPDDEIEAPEI